MSDFAFFETSINFFYLASAITKIRLAYSMYQEDIRIKGSKKLSDLTSNVSDHYPELLGINIDIEHTSVIREEVASKRIVWDKVDKQKYAELVDLGIMDIQGDLDNEQMDLNELENVITKTHSVLRDSAEKSNTKRKYGKNRLTLKVWNEEISCKLRANRAAHKAWKKGGKPQLINNPLLVAKNLTRLEYRRAIRNEVARKRLDTKTKIIETKTYDKKLFFKLVKKQRQSGNSSINDLMVGDEKFEGKNVINGWVKHFETLATPAYCDQYDENFYELCKNDYNTIDVMTKDCEKKQITELQIRKALKHMNKGKSEDSFGLSAENLLYASDLFIDFLTMLINKIFKKQRIPEILKTGLLTPIYKNKGERKDAKNYRGITVLPIVLKLIEYLLREDLREVTLPQQSKLQRGFTEQASPLNAAFLVEEFYRERKDLEKPVYIAFLDAKSAFDVVVNEILMRKVYLSGVKPSTWRLINEIHIDSHSAINWNGNVSRKFEIKQGVKQGGLLSADLFKVYSNDTFETLTNTNVGGTIGDINVCAPGCADDVAVQSNNPHDLQILVNGSKLNSDTHRCILQPQKKCSRETRTKKFTKISELIRMEDR